MTDLRINGEMHGEDGCIYRTAARDERHLWELDGIRRLSTQRDCNLLSTDDGGLSTTNLWASGSKRLSQRSVAGGWRSADCTQPSLLPSMFGNDPQETELADLARFGWIWFKSSSIRGQKPFRAIWLNLVGICGQSLHERNASQSTIYKHCSRDLPHLGKN